MKQRLLAWQGCFFSPQANSSGVSFSFTTWSMTTISEGQQKLTQLCLYLVRRSESILYAVFPLLRNQVRKKLPFGLEGGSKHTDHVIRQHSDSYRKDFRALVSHFNFLLLQHTWLIHIFAELPSCNTHIFTNNRNLCLVQGLVKHFKYLKTNDMS